MDVGPNTRPTDTRPVTYRSIAPSSPTGGDSVNSLPSDSSTFSTQSRLAASTWLHDCVNGGHDNPPDVVALTLAVNSGANCVRRPHFSFRQRLIPPRRTRRPSSRSPSRDNVRRSSCRTSGSVRLIKSSHRVDHRPLNTALHPSSNCSSHSFINSFFANLSSDQIITFRIILNQLKSKTLDNLIQ